MSDVQSLDFSYDEAAPILTSKGGVEIDVARIGFPTLDGEETRPLVDAIIEQRGSVLDLYKMLLHSPPVAAGWLGHLTAIRQKSSLPGDVRELVIMEIAALNEAAYEAAQHHPIAIRMGLTEAQLAALPRWSRTDFFDERLRSVLAYTDAMTRDIRVPDSVFAAVAQHFGDRELVELTATIATYNMVSRFLEALEISPH